MNNSINSSNSFSIQPSFSITSLIMPILHALNAIYLVFINFYSDSQPNCLIHKV